ncbi:hypothetical protein [Sphaerochaeta sp. UBA5849]|jgi:hypothetical protein|uniref:hypothetical protein n=1 Tax=Sphaerochaeta sp. UBA5849 TaxID=1947475 RepID=UPI0031F48FA3
MKKTIAILLVLVIGMVGVWAEEANATLNLQTTIDEVNRIAITTGSTYSFPTLSTVDPIVSEASMITHTVAFSTAAVDVGYIHYKTNNANGVTVSMNGTYLANAANNAYIIPYQIDVLAGDVSGDTTKSLIKLNATGDTTADVVLFEATSGTSLFTDHRKIQISGVAGSAANYPAGLYSATVTFKLTAQ